MSEQKELPVFTNSVTEAALFNAAGECESRSVVLYGATQTGKTYHAQAIAKMLKLKAIIEIDGAPIKPALANWRKGILVITNNPSIHIEGFVMWTIEQALEQLTRDNERKATLTVLMEVANERKRQNKKWGWEHDDGHDLPDFVSLINHYAAWANVIYLMKQLNKSAARKRLIQVAAIAVAAIEAFDRKYPQ